MGVDLRMEPYAEMFQKERPESRVLDEFYFHDVDTLFDSMGLTWDHYSPVDKLDDQGRLPHEAALKLLHAIESHPMPQDVPSRQLVIDRRDKLLTMLRFYRQWHEHPERIPTQVQEVLAGRAPGMAGRIGHLQERHPWLALALS